MGTDENITTSNTEPEVDRCTILMVAAETDTDPRSVEKEILALQGKGEPVRGRAGAKIRRALARRVQQHINR